MGMEPSGLDTTSGGLVGTRCFNVAGCTGVRRDVPKLPEIHPVGGNAGMRS